MHWLILTVFWYLQTVVVTLAFAPLCFWAFRHLKDRGASLLRPMTCLLFVWPVWFLSSIGSGIIPYSSVTLWISLIVLGLVGWALLLKAHLVDSRSIKHLILAEVVFLISFSGFVWFHGYGPAITDQEKPSDLMMLSSAMRAESMPPADAWFAGHDVNYYYLGYLIFGSFGRMVNGSPAETFNLALATVFGMAVVTSVGLVTNVIGRWSTQTTNRISGALAVSFVVLAGNPWAAFTWLADRSGQWNLAFFGDAIGWNATRQLPSGVDYPAISEFPAFSFILGDLHPHLMALPFAIAALGFAWMLATLPSIDSIRERRLRLIVAGSFLGALYALNAWDYPTYFALALLAYLWGDRTSSMRDRVIGSSLMTISSLVCWLPFYVAFDPPTKSGDSAFAKVVSDIPVFGSLLSSVASYPGPRTTLGEYFGHFGAAWTIAIILIGIELVRRRDQSFDRRIQSQFIGIGAMLIIAALLMPASLLIICGLPVIAIFLLLERDRQISLENVALALFGIGFSLTLIPEFFYVMDIFGNSRMNTVFKVYYQVWLMLGLASALALCGMVRTFRDAQLGRYAVLAGSMIALSLGLIYPVVAGHQWLQWRSPDMEWQGIDGLAYLEEQHPDEYMAVEWLWNNALSDDVILAAGGCDWHTSIGRPSSASGVPSLIGWWGHERQWHLGNADETNEMLDRISAIPILYSSQSLDLFDQYGITLIYVGEVERQGVPDPNNTSGDGLVKTTEFCAPGPFVGVDSESFPGFGWTEVFHEKNVRIFRRNGT